MKKFPTEIERYRKKITSDLKMAINKNDDIDKGDFVWGVIEGVSAVLDDNKHILGTITGSAKLLCDIADIVKKEPDSESIKTIPNPMFLWSGHEEGDTKYTQKYLHNRKLKGVGGGAVALVGTVASNVTQVDIAGVLQHSNAGGSTIAHIAKLSAIGKKHKQSKTISSWLDLVIFMKLSKLGVRGSQFAGAAIPISAVGLGTGLGAAAVKLSVKLTMTKTCLATSSQLHWRAFQEQKISGHICGKTGQIGPASKIVYELFKKRGATRIFGQYDIDRIINEPSGWMCISDKLLLI